MRRTFLIGVLMALLTTLAWGQQGNTAVGVNLGYATADGYNAFRLGAEVSVGLYKGLYVTPGFDYYFISDHRDLWSIDANLQYLIPVAEGFTFYPLVGATYVRYGDNYFGGNVGAGIIYDLTANVGLKVEAKYQVIEDFDQLALKTGFIFRF